MSDLMTTRGLLATALGLAGLTAGVVAFRVAGVSRAPRAEALMPSGPGRTPGRLFESGPSARERIRESERTARNLANEPYRAPFGPDADDPDAAARHRHAALKTLREAGKRSGGGALAGDLSAKPFEMPAEPAP